jgi:hypothetical protein
MLTKSELIKLVHKALADSKDKDVDCERLTSFEQDNDEVLLRFFGLEEEDDS